MPKRAATYTNLETMMLRNCFFGLTTCMMFTTAAWGELRHQYTFNDGTASDLVGGMDGTVVNPMGHVVRFGGELDLRANNGVTSGDPANGVYVDLPNFMISDLAFETFGVISFEMWATQQDRRTWSRLFDLGTSNAGEDMATSGDASDYIFLTPQSGGNTVQFTTRNGAVMMDGNAALGPALSTNAPHHYVAVIDQGDTTEGADGTMSLYIDGALADTGPVATSLFIDLIIDDNNWLGRSQWGGDPLFDGTYDEFRIYDHALTAQEVADSFAAGPEPFPGTNPTFVIHRDDRTISIENTGASDSIAAYTLTSTAGSLDAGSWTPISGRLDAGGDGSFDSVAWAVGTSTADELSEAADSGSGGTVDMSTSISLGAAWLQSPMEDVFAQVQLGDGSTVNARIEYEGNGGAPFARSDLNFDGVVDAADWPIYAAGLFGDFAGMSLAQAYAFGDLDGNLVNDVLDFRLFKSDFIAANGAAAFAALGTSIPEPSSVALSLLLVAGLSLVGMRKSGMGHLRSGVLRAASIGVVAAVLLSAFGQRSFADLVNQWTFNELGGTVLTDSVNGEHGQLIGSGGSIGGGLVTLPGGGSGAAPYVDLPNGIVSRHTDATFEGWAIVDGAQSWARLFDFGSSNLGGGVGDGGELNAPGGGGEGEDYFMLSVSRDTDNNVQRLEFRNRDPVFLGADAGNVTGTTQLLDTSIMTTVGEPFHFAVVFDSQNDAMRQYRDGLLVDSAQVTFDLGNLNDVNNWLGRSNWTNDASFQGSFDEFRIYDEALDDDAIMASFDAGPEPSTSPPPSLELEVNTITGDVSILNNQMSAIELDFYELTSPGGALSPSGWDSLSDQDIDSNGSGFGESWDEGGEADAFQLGEAFLLGSTLIEPSASLSLGRAFDTSVFGLEMDGDLAFIYSDPRGFTFAGPVSYIAEGMPPMGIEGDYNGNGQVEQGDLDLVLLNWGTDLDADWVTDTVDQAELDGVLLNWGNTAALGAAAGVPEPSSALIAVMAGLVAVVAGARRACRIYS